MKIIYPKLVKVYTVEFKLSSGASVVHDFYDINIKSDGGKLTSMRWTEYKYSFMSIKLKSVDIVHIISTKRRIRWFTV